MIKLGLDIDDAGDEEAVSAGTSGDADAVKVEGADEDASRMEEVD